MLVRRNMPIAWRTCLLAALLFGATACAGREEGAAAASAASDAISVTAVPVPLNDRDPAQQRAGRLEYRGGLRLQSDDARFGGISGLRWLDSDVPSLLGITDAGNWLLLEPVEDAHRLTGIRSARMGDLRGPSGEILEGKANADAESLTLIEGCDGARPACRATGAIIGFEHDHRVLVYDLLPNGAPGGMPSDAGLAEAFLKVQPSNGGAEAIAGSPPHLRIYAEDVRDEDDLAAAIDLSCVDCDGWPNRETPFGVAMPSPFKPTDADWSPAGQLLLGRSFSLLEGVGARIDLVVEGEAGAPPTGELRNLAILHPPETVDNFEGLAVRVEDGRTFLYIVSDDNFSPLQRTLLLKFELMQD